MAKRDSDVDRLNRLVDRAHALARIGKSSPPSLLKEIDRLIHKTSHAAEITLPEDEDAARGKAMADVLGSVLSEGELEALLRRLS